MVKRMNIRLFFHISEYSKKNTEIKINPEIHSFLKGFYRRLNSVTSLATIINPAVNRYLVCLFFLRNQ